MLSTGLPNTDRGGADSCNQWSASVSQALVDDPTIDVVVTAAIGSQYLEKTDIASDVLTADAIEPTWKRWTDAGLHVIVLTDTPNWALGDIPTCVEKSGLIDPCAVPSTARFADPLGKTAAASSNPLVASIDMNDFFCDNTTCHVAVGGVVAIGDGNHMTSTFSRSLGPFLDRAFAALPPDFTTTARR